jgi:EAL domain-containing protein (putative c-di-GMP-specific phosphodiesterase class I)
VLEITESVVMDDAAANSVLLGKLKALGVHLAIDDFGTGYSSLNYLKRFPVDVLKIDKAFVDGVGQDVEATAIVEAVITLAHTLGMEVVAEGVETAVQVDQLCRLGCDVGQGYYFAKPLPVDAVDAIVGGGTASVTPPAIVGDGLRALSAPGSPQRAAKPCPMTSAIRDGMYRSGR